MSVFQRDVYVIWFQIRRLIKVIVKRVMKYANSSKWYIIAIESYSVLYFPVYID